MSAESVDRSRFEQIVEMKQDQFLYDPLREAIADELEGDKQFRILIALSEQSRRFVDIRGSQIGPNDQTRHTIAEFGDDLDEAIHHRADEIIAEVCASLVRQDDRWIADDPESVDSTDIQSGLDAIYQALQWLDDHEEIVDRLNLTYPEDEW